MHGIYDHAISLHMYHQYGLGNPIVQFGPTSAWSVLCQFSYLSYHLLIICHNVHRDFNRKISSALKICVVSLTPYKNNIKN